MAPTKKKRRTTSRDQTPLLRCEELDVSYGRVQVLFGVDFEVADGELVALLGTNGAGKSTLLKTISGLLRPDRGRIEFEQQDLLGMPAHRIPAMGVVQMPGGKGVFPTLSVQENLRLARWLRRDDTEAVEEAEERVLELFGALRRRYSTMAGNLSGGEQQMLTLGMAMMNEPRLLMIDELSLGLAPSMVGELIDVVRRVHETGVTMIVVEQSVNVALDLAERAAFMEKGEVRFEGPARELLDRPDILRSVFVAGASGVENGQGAKRGRRRSAKRARGKRRKDTPLVLSCRGVTKRFGGVVAVDDVDLDLREGEIVGLIGQNGSGKTTLFDCISGFRGIDGGQILYRGHDITSWEPHERASVRIGRSFQEARLYPSLTTQETIAVALERHLANRDFVAAAFHLPASVASEREARRRTDELIELMGLEAYREKFVGELSTGTRRIVELASMLAQDPDVVLLDEPSAGVAQREAEALGPLLRRVQEHTGCSMIVIEHDMPLLGAICDRMVCLELGRVIAEGATDAVLDDPRVIESYLGTDQVAVQRSGSRG